MIDVEWFVFNREGGGKIIIPIEEVGVISSHMRNVGTDEVPVWEPVPNKTLIRINSLQADVVVDHDIMEIIGWVRE